MARIEWDAERAGQFKNEWLADLIEKHRERIIDEWMRFIRARGGPHFAAWTDERFRSTLAPTVDRVADVLRTGDLESAENYIRNLLAERIAGGFMLQEIEHTLLGLQAIVLGMVEETTRDPDKRLQALKAATYLHDVSTLRVAEIYQDIQSQQQARFTALYELGMALSKTLDMDAVLNTAVGQAAEALRAESAAVVLAGEEGRPAEVRASYRASPELAAVVPDICRRLGCCLDRVEGFEAREVVRAVPDVRESEPLAEWSAVLAAEGCRSMVCVPLLAAGRVLGGLLVCISEPHDFAEFETDFVLALATHTATAMQNARLFEEAKGKRELSLLLDAARLFTSTLDLDEVLRQVARLAVESVGADYSAVLLPDEARHSFRIRSYYARAGKAQDASRRAIEVVEPAGIEIERGATGSVFAAAHPVLIRNYPEFDGRIEELVEVIGSMLVLPMRLRDKVIGAFVVVSLRTDAFTEDDLSLAVGIANQAAVAIENARLYERERNIAETFQRSFLPVSLPTIEGYELAARYQAALTEAEVGGDFYDVFSVGAGKTAVLIADVSGKGLNAAMYTAMGKYMVRAYAAEDPSPGSVLVRFNRVLFKYTPSGMFITAFYAVLDERKHTLTYGSAGHDQPMLYSKRLDYLTLLDVTGPGLGAVPEAKYGERSIKLESGDAILMYTDGATDVRCDGEMLALEGLERIFRASVHTPAETAAEGVFRGVLDFCGGRLRDDIALMVLRKYSE